MDHLFFTTMLLLAKKTNSDNSLKWCSFMVLKRSLKFSSYRSRDTNNLTISFNITYPTIYTKKNIRKDYVYFNCWICK